MKLLRYFLVFGLLFLFCTVLAVPQTGRTKVVESNATTALPAAPPKKTASAPSCRVCHSAYYKSWDAAPHGTCFRRVDRNFIAGQVTLPAKDFTSGTATYAIRDNNGILQMVLSRPEDTKAYDILYAIGGKRFFYFLTPLGKGCLQLVPLAYDISRKEWFDTAQNRIPHVPGRQPDAPPELWKSRAFSFSTVCYNCHVNSYSHAYDLEHDSYPPLGELSGLQCASCHGPGETHARTQEQAKKHPQKQKKKSAHGIIRGGAAFDNKQINANCAVCHALELPLTQGFTPGDDYFDNFSLITLEHPAYYPDGRAKGETFTFGSWQLSPCALSGELNCLHCHTPGGLFRFPDAPNKACAPCHAALVADPVPHTHHSADSDAGKCITCHMPRQAINGIRQTDHSMLPPAPALTKAYGSPNACGSCHADKDAAWADGEVRKWQKNEYQAPLLKRAGLIQAARKRDWTQAPEMVRYLSEPGRNTFFAASLLRLTAGYNSKELWKAALQALEDPSPMVRAAAVAYLSRSSCPDAFPALLHAIGDSKRLVRIQAAAEISRVPIKGLPMLIQAQLKNAMTEYVSSLIARPDQWNAHYRMGTLFAQQGDKKVARSAYEKALELEPHALPALVNLSLLLQQAGELQKAEETIRKALQLAPENIQALLNLGVILGKKGDNKASEAALRHVLDLAPAQAEAAFNLAVLLANDKTHNRLEEALRYARQAYTLRPEELRYAFALAYYLNRSDQQDEAASILKKSLQNSPNIPDMYLLLGKIQTDQGDTQAARRTYESGLRMKGATEKFKQLLTTRLQELPEDSAETN